MFDNRIRSTPLLLDDSYLYHAVDLVRFNLNHIAYNSNDTASNITIRHHMALTAPHQPYAEGNTRCVEVNTVLFEIEEDDCFRCVIFGHSIHRRTLLSLHLLHTKRFERVHETRNPSNVKQMLLFSHLKKFVQASCRFFGTDCTERVNSSLPPFFLN